MRHTRSATVLVATLTLVTVSAGGPVGPGTAGAKPPCDPSWRQVGALTVPDGYLGLKPTGAVDVISSGDVRFATTATRSLTPDLPWLVEWDGRTVAPSAQQPPFLDPTWSDLGAMDFDSADHGWVIGEDLLEGLVMLPYSARWHDDRWTRIPFAPAPDPDTQQVRLVDVVSVSSTDGWAVGTTLVDGEPGGALIQRWDGRQWTVVDHPGQDVPGASLLTVTAVAPDDVWVAGSRHAETGDAPFVEHWDGTQWTVAELPELPGEGLIRALDASAGDDVWAVGNTDHFGDLPPLVMHFDGTDWTVVTDLPAGGGEAVAVHASSPTDAWVVRNTPDNRTDVLRWDGGGWEVMEIPGTQDVGRGADGFGIDGTGPNDVWLLARSFAPPSSQQPQTLLVARHSCGGRR